MWSYTTSVDDTAGGACQLCINSPPFGVTLSTQDGANMRRPDKLHNTKCFFYTQPGGCKKENCRFLHDEEPTAVVFCDAAENMQYTGSYVSVYTHPHVKVEDARIFFGNLPPPFGKDLIRAIVEPHGEIMRIDIWGSNLKNKHCSGFVHMKSIDAAKAAIYDLNFTLIDGVQLYANLKSSSVYWKPLPDWDPSLYYIEPKQYEESEDISIEVPPAQPPPLVDIKMDTIISPVSVMEQDWPLLPTLSLN